MNLFDNIKNKEYSDILDNLAVLRTINIPNVNLTVNLNNIKAPYMVGTYPIGSDDYVRVTFFDSKEEVIKTELANIILTTVNNKEFAKLEMNILKSNLLAEIGENTDNIHNLYFNIKAIIDTLKSLILLPYLDNIEIIELLRKEPIYTNIQNIAQHMKSVINVYNSTIIPVNKFKEYIDNKNPLYVYYCKTIQFNGNINELYLSKFKAVSGVYNIIGENNIEFKLNKVFKDNYKLKYFNLIYEILNDNYNVSNFDEFKEYISKVYDIDEIIYNDLICYIEEIIISKQISSTDINGKQLYNFSEYNWR